MGSCILNVCVCSVVQSCLTLCNHGLQLTSLLCPWDSPGKNTRVGCHSLLQSYSIQPMKTIMENLKTIQKSVTCYSQSSLHGVGSTSHKFQGHQYLPSCRKETFLASKCNTNKGRGKNKHVSQSKLYKVLMIKSNDS